MEERKKYTRAAEEQNMSTGQEYRSEVKNRSNERTEQKGRIETHIRST